MGLASGGVQMTPIDEPASFQPQGTTPEGRKSSASSEQPVNAELVAFTIERATGRLVKVEAAADGGARRELSESELKSLVAASPEMMTLESIVEQAFEAGIASVLGKAAEEEESAQDDEDAELSRVLLRSLIKCSAATQLMQGDVLRRAIVGTLIAQGSRSPDANSEGSASH
jgi:hypothetical protein